ncbi:MAG TPA: DUF5709 domain-containing protein [Mycobacteriales bacterium]|nr:DUF5709 domain-containing protein [Mycobacteriales bacterium]
MTGAREPDPGSALEDEGMPDQSDALPAKTITGDAQEGIAPPGDHPVASVDYGVTESEMREGEPLEAKLSRETPERSDGPATAEHAPYPEDPDERVGRFAEVADDETGQDQDAFAVDVGADGGGFAPEERAMHTDS